MGIQLVNELYVYTQPEGTWPCSNKPVIEPYTELGQSSPHLHKAPTTPRVPTWGLFFGGFWTRVSLHLISQCVLHVSTVCSTEQLAYHTKTIHFALLQAHKGFPTSTPRKE